MKIAVADGYSERSRWNEEHEASKNVWGVTLQSPAEPLAPFLRGQRPCGKSQECQQNNLLRPPRGLSGDPAGTFVPLEDASRATRNGKVYGAARGVAASGSVL